MDDAGRRIAIETPIRQPVDREPCREHEQKLRRGDQEDEMVRRRLGVATFALTLAIAGVTPAPLAAVETTEGKARVGTNPRTGETIKIPAKKIPFTMVDYIKGIEAAIANSPAVDPDE